LILSKRSASKDALTPPALGECADWVGHSLASHGCHVGGLGFRRRRPIAWNKRGLDMDTLNGIVQQPGQESVAELVSKYQRVALVLQGGGALGAYQGGVYHALSQAGCEPNWLSGVSIGAINASIIAGNKPEDRLTRLQQFWDLVSGRKIWAYTPEGDYFRMLRNHTSAWMTMMMGQPGFFEPRLVGPWFHPPGSASALSYYESERLQETLRGLIDFDLLNSGKVRLTVGAVNVRSGNFIYFDNAKERIEPAHIMASGALPPALPAIKIAGELYWDGGIVSNTPLQYLLEEHDSLSTLVFQVDLFSARGSLPRDMRDVMGRHKDIMYSSRTRQNTDQFRRLHSLRRHLARALAKIPQADRDEQEEKTLQELSRMAAINIIHLIYQQKSYEGHAKDYEFSGTSMREHWETGYHDTRRTLRHPEWLAPTKNKDGVVVHDLHRDDDA
ncbi:MAG TPA: patatin-like phospholipase family protein, partial [Stellaceae bacterium]|nr:patatin-like phospholipase family protein [Stellaceae bacterium]